eukprot:scaffold4663_cov104-Isochrysis_galbana.AAC.12
MAKTANGKEQTAQKLLDRSPRPTAASLGSRRLHAPKMLLSSGLLNATTCMRAAFPRAAV